MVKTQIQLPDHLYREAKRIAKEYEMSFAEVVRRSLEYMARLNPPGRLPGKQWKLPEARDLGDFLAPEEQWTELCHDEW